MEDQLIASVYFALVLKIYVYICFSHFYENMKDIMYKKFEIIFSNSDPTKKLAIHLNKFYSDTSNCENRVKPPKDITLWSVDIPKIGIDSMVPKNVTK